MIGVEVAVVIGVEIAVVKWGSFEVGGGDGGCEKR